MVLATIVVMVQGGEVFSATKVIFITWVGTKCKPMLKAKSSQHRLPIYKYALVRSDEACPDQVCGRTDCTDTRVWVGYNEYNRGRSSWPPSSRSSSPRT